MIMNNNETEFAVLIFMCMAHEPLLIPHTSAFSEALLSKQHNLQTDVKMKVLLP